MRWNLLKLEPAKLIIVLAFLSCSMSVLASACAVGAGDIAQIG